MNFIWDKITEWLKGLLVGGIVSNLSGLFDSINTRVADVASTVGKTPQAWNGSIFSMIKSLSENVVVPIAGIILTFVMCLELIQLLIDRNNMHDFETFIFFKWVFKGYMIWAERNNIDAKAQSIIFLKEHNIGSIEELEDQIDALRSERNALHSSIREKKNRMKEINELRQAIRDYRRTKDVYAQYKASGWSPKFYNEHRKDIEAHKKAKAVYSSVDGKMPTLKELSAEYDALKAEKENDDAALEELKPQLTTLNHIKYNFDVLERDYLPEEQDLRRDEHQER